jgi:putative membrane protein
VSLNVAGLESSQDGGNLGQVLLPVAPRPVAAGIIGRVLPGVDLASLVPAPAPPRARWRAWLQWPNLGVAVDDRVFATRRGFLTRHTAVIPHARTQSVSVTQGPWQRHLELASVRVDSTPGPVAVVGLHRDAIEARAIAEAQLVRAARARAEGPAERWMVSRVPAVGSSGPEHPGVSEPPTPPPSPSPSSESALSSPTEPVADQSRPVAPPDQPGPATGVDPERGPNP